MTITNDTPIAMLTVGQLKEVLEEISEKNKQPPKEFLYGLRGIARQFQCSIPTAHIYAKTFLKPAVKKEGKIFFTDKAMAIELFGQKRGGRK